VPDAEYWNSRATRHGHTGWSDWVIYRFDQFARLAAMRAVLESLKPPRNGRAVDYGTGTGDFACMLSRRYEQVVAIDISGKVLDIARKRHVRRTNVTFLHADAERGSPTEPVDLVLTVTVLNHIMDDASLRATMEHLADVLKPGGCFVALESCVETETARHSTYQRNHTHGEWETMFERCGLVLEHCFGFYHPTVNRCRTFDRYSRSLWVRLLRRMGPSQVTARVLGALAALYLLGRRDYFWSARPTDALRLMIFRKPEAACASAKKGESPEAPCECADSQLLPLEVTAARPPASAPAPRLHPGG